jgi:prepilin-type N-terminal cleavage/methylation domain-containing protein
LKKPAKPRAGFTLVEMLIASTVAVVLGLVVFSLLNLGVTLFAQNISINQTQSRGLSATEKLGFMLAAAAEAPTLVNDTGAPVTGNGPAAGVRYLIPASAKPYSVPWSVGATANSFAITKGVSQPEPMVGDTITMFDLGFRGVATSVTPSGSSYAVNFGSSVGSRFTPQKAAGTVIPAGSKCFVLKSSAVISVNSLLRYYPRARSVSQDGAIAFNAAANFVPMATLLPVETQTNCFPFQYLDPTRRSVDVKLRVRAPAHGARIKGFYTFQNLQTTAAYRAGGQW